MASPTAPIDERDRRLRANRQLLFYARLSFFIVGTTPWWLPLLRAYLPLGATGDLADGLFVLVCHRLPERTIELRGGALPLCSRCAGLFAGLAMGAVVMWPKLELRAARWVLLVAGLVMVADVIMQQTGVHPIWHSTRLATGMAVGWAAVATLLSAIRREPQSSS